MAWKKQWFDDEVDTLVEMWEQGYTAPEIAKELGKQIHQVRMFVSRNRERLGLESRHTTEYKMKRRGDTDEFDRLWKGPMPYLHWVMTKPWSVKSDDSTV